MSNFIKTFCATLGLAFLSAASLAQVPATTPANAPAGSTGLCRDGTYWTGSTKQGACRNHKGIQDWYAVSPTSTSNAPATTAAAPATPTTSPQAMTPAPTSAMAASSQKTAPVNGPAAAGGGPGQVWVNGSSKVYHCPSDRWYGKTKQGQYMTEAQAVAAGNRPDHGKACGT